MPRARASKSQDPGKSLEKPKRKAKATSRAKPVRKPRQAKRTQATEVVQIPYREHGLRHEPTVTDFEQPARAIVHGHAVHSHHHDRAHNPHARKQRLSMILSIGVIMTVIVVAWALTLRRTIGQAVQAPKAEEKQEMDFDDLRDELQSTFSDVKQELGKLSQITETVTPAASPITNTMSPTVTESAAPETSTTTITPTTQPTLPN